MTGDEVSLKLVLKIVLIKKVLHVSLSQIAKLNLVIKIKFVFKIMQFTSFEMIYIVYPFFVDCPFKKWQIYWRLK